MKNLQITLPFWVRAILLTGVVCILAGAGLISYRLYMQPKTLTIAVGSLDGEAKFRASHACLVLAMFGSATMIAARPLRTAARSGLIFRTKFRMLGTAGNSPSFTGGRRTGSRSSTGCTRRTSGSAAD